MFFETTIQGNNADLAMVQKTIIDTLHQARAGGGGGGRRVLEHLPLCHMMPKVPFCQGNFLFYFILLNTLLWRPAQSNY